MKKKFFASAYYAHSPSGYTVLLDDAPARTPRGNALKVTSEPLAKAIAAEWQAQADILRKEAMPFTQMACVAIDLVAGQRDAALADILPYGETDLVCYRAGDTPELAQEQAELLDPVMQWAREKYGIFFKVTDGVMPIRQTAETQDRFHAALLTYDDYRLTALAVSVKPLGSLLLALAFIEGRIDAAKAFQLSHLEEIYETAKWGGDEEKDAKMQKLKEELENVERFLGLL